MNIRAFPRINWRYVAAAAAMVAAILAYYLNTWGSFVALMAILDFSPEFMPDFFGHYYPMSQQIFEASAPRLGYFYSSFFALLLHPISTFALPVAMIAWCAVQGLCMLLYFFLAKKIMNMSSLGALIFAGMLLTSFPILHNIKWGQVSTLLLVFVVAAFACYQSGNRIAAGVLLAVPAAIKFYPVLFLFYFAVKRDVFACAAFIVATLFFYCIFPALFLGFDHWLNFEKTQFYWGSLPAKISLTENSQYVANVGSQWLIRLFGMEFDEQWWQRLVWLGYGVVVGCLILTWQLQRKPMADRYALPMVAIFACTPFFVQTSWPHYFVYLPIGQLALLCYCKESMRTSTLSSIPICVLSIASALISSMFFFGQFQGWQTYNGTGMLFLSNVLLLVALLLAAFFNDKPQPGRLPVQLQ